MMHANTRVGGYARSHAPAHLSLLLYVRVTVQPDCVTDCILRFAVTPGQSSGDLAVQHGDVIIIPFSEELPTGVSQRVLAVNWSPDGKEIIFTYASLRSRLSFCFCLMEFAWEVVFLDLQTFCIPLLGISH